MSWQDRCVAALGVGILAAAIAVGVYVAFQVF